MCTNPLVINGYEVACRECDQCVSTYKNTWVSRCVAEKQTSNYAYAFTLTYADKDGEPPLGARVFRYSDVSAMWKRIRSAGKRKWKQNIELRYVVVGEKGTKFGRCHYHGVLFSSHPVIELGEISSARGGFAYKRRLNWSIWGHGFVEFQIADRQGMAYALKYILKSRMTAERSRGHGREGKTEWLASSYLWCSKSPPVGGKWLYGRLQEMVELGMCPSSLRVRVPGGGDWYVGGKAQKDMCLFLHHANNEFRQERGRDLAGWKTLIHSVSDEIEKLDTGETVNRKPLEWLTNGEEPEEQNAITEEQAAQQWAQFKQRYAEKKRIAAPITEARRAIRECGHILPCDACRNSLQAHDLADLEQERELRFAQWSEKHNRGHQETPAAYKERFDEWWLTRLRPSRGCALRDDKITKDKFARLVPLTKATPGIAAKAAIGKAL